MKRGLLILFGVLLVASFAMGQTSIYDIQYVEDPATDDASPLVDQEVTVTGWVTFEPMSYDGNSFYIADAPGAWNGINVYTGDDNYNLGFAWEVEVTGTVIEYWGKTEIEATDVTVLDDMPDWSDLPAAVAATMLTADQLPQADAALSEQYEGVLVRVEDVTRNATDMDYGEWFVEDGEGNVVRIDNPSSDEWGYFHKTAEGMPYEHIEGIVDYTYDNYKIVPEIAHQIKVAVDVDEGWFTPIAYFQQVRPMDMTIRQDDGGNNYTFDTSYASARRYGGDPEDGEEVAVHAIVTMPTGLAYAGDAGSKFIMSDALVGDTSEPWSSVLSFNPDSEVYGNLFIGDEIIFYGYVDEYETGPSSMTELWLTSAFTVLNEGQTVPTPAVVTVPELRDPMTAEKWGNVFVDVQNSIVTDNELQYEMFAIDDDLGDEWYAVKVDDDSDALDGYTLPPVGANITSVQGWIYHHFGTLDEETENDWVYKVVPNYPEDIVIGEAPPNILAVSRDYATPGADQDVTVTATVADNNEVAAVSIFYKLGDDGSYTEVAMTQGEGLDWSGVIPGQTEGSLVWYYVEATDDIDQTSTAPSDPEANNYGYWAMDELGIYQLQYTSFPGGASPYNGMLATVSGVVSTPLSMASWYADGVHGAAYFIHEGDDAPFSGMVVHYPEDQMTFNMGDHVEITGTVDESGDSWSFKWGNNTRIISAVTASIESSGNDFTVHETDIASINAALEAHESVFVKLTDVEVTAINQYDVSITDGSGETFLFDDDLYNSSDGPLAGEEDVAEWFGNLAGGETLDFVQGVVTYSFGSWKLEARGGMDIAGFSSVGDGEAAQPFEFALAPVYPNPFNPSTFIQYSIPSNAEVKLVVYNALGQKVRTLINAPLRAGNHTAYWNGMSDAGAQVASGTYYLRLLSEGQQQVQKMVLMK